MLRQVGTLLSATRRSRILLGVAAPVLTLILILLLLEISYRQEEAREASLLSTGSISSSPRADRLKLILEPDDAQRALLAQPVIPVAPIGPTDMAEPSLPEPTQGSPQADVAARDPVPLPRSRPIAFECVGHPAPRPTYASSRPDVESATCPCRKLRLGYIGGAARPKPARPTSDQRSGRRGRSVRSSPVTNACGPRCGIFGTL